jgi:hypothetical protein
MTALYLVPQGEFDIDEFAPSANATAYAAAYVVTEDVGPTEAPFVLSGDNTHLIGIFTSEDVANSVGLFLADNAVDMGLV